MVFQVVNPSFSTSRIGQGCSTPHSQTNTNRVYSAAHLSTSFRVCSLKREKSGQQPLSACWKSTKAIEPARNVRDIVFLLVSHSQFWHTQRGLSVLRYFGCATIGACVLASSVWSQTTPSSEVERLKKEVTDLRAENQLLRQLITQGVAAPSSASAATSAIARQPASPETTSAMPAGGGAPAVPVNMPVRQQATTALAATAEKALGYWMTSSSGKRHNTHCRWYGNSRGRPCGQDEGIACLKCGG